MMSQLLKIVCLLVAIAGALAKPSTLAPLAALHAAPVVASASPVLTPAVASALVSREYHGNFVAPYYTAPAASYLSAAPYVAATPYTASYTAPYAAPLLASPYTAAYTATAPLLLK